MTGRVLCAVVFGVAFIWGVSGTVREARAIAYWESDFDIVENALPDVPADLLNPGSEVTVRVVTGAGNGSGSVIAPNWIISAAHVLELGNPINHQYVIDGVTYKAALDEFDEPTGQTHAL